jgi:hypothetical protein
MQQENDKIMASALLHEKTLSISRLRPSEAGPTTDPQINQPHQSSVLFTSCAQIIFTAKF